MKYSTGGSYRSKALLDKMADEEEVTLNGKPISELRVVDLKKELDQRGLSKVGSKVQLTERLKAVFFFTFKIILEARF